MPPSSLTFVMIARIPPEGVLTFDTYEAHVLPLMLNTVVSCSDGCEAGIAWSKFTS